MKRKDLAAKFKSIDFFATDISFRENGGDSFGSIFGAFNSLIITLIVAIYGINKFIILKNYEDTLFNEYSVKWGLTNDELG